MMRRLAGFGLLVVVTGCSGTSPAAGPGTLPPVAATVAPTPTPPVSPSAMPVEKPALADEATEAGAEAFARYWMAVRNEAYQTLDPTELARISASSCVTCTSYATSMRRGASAGERWEGGIATVIGVAAPPIANRTTRVLVDYGTTRFVAYDKQGQVLAEQPARKRATLEISVERSGQAWRVREVRRL